MAIFLNNSLNLAKNVTHVTSRHAFFLTRTCARKETNVTHVTSRHTF